MTEVKIIVPADARDYLQRLAMEQTARENVVDRIIEKHANDPVVIEGAAFKTYMTSLAEVTAENELAKEAFAAQYLPPWTKEHDSTWSLDFATCEVTISVKCDCEIPDA
ncbi:MAG: hypothetical protein RR505_02790 [Raoultibacter sp.]